MEIMKSLVDFFGIDQIADVATFPELLQVFLYVMCGVNIVCVILKSLFAVPGMINKIN